jgi:hypothetical protein
MFTVAGVTWMESTMDVPQPATVAARPMDNTTLKQERKNMITLLEIATGLCAMVSRHSLHFTSNPN